MMLLIVCTGPIQQNGMDPKNSEIQKLQNHIQQLEYNVKAQATVSLEMASDQHYWLLRGILLDYYFSLRLLIFLK